MGFDALQVIDQLKARIADRDGENFLVHTAVIHHVQFRHRSDLKHTARKRRSREKNQ